MADNDKTLKLVATGDVIPKFDPADNQFDFIRPILKGGDITFGQLEFPFTKRGVRQLGETPISEPSRTPADPMRPPPGDSFGKPLV